jgi:hypothetical protein
MSEVRASFWWRLPWPHDSWSHTKNQVGVSNGKVILQRLHDHSRRNP